MTGLLKPEADALEREVARLGQILDAHKRPDVAFILIATVWRDEPKGVRLRGRCVTHTAIMDDPAVAAFCEGLAADLRRGAS
jgi:hypothetical protein